MAAPSINFRPWVNMDPIKGREGQPLADLVVEHKHYLGETNLSGENLNGLSLVGAYLSQANLCGVNLFSSDLTGAKLHHSDLTNANLKYCVLRGAALFGAIIEGADFQNAVYDEETEFPSGFDPVGAGCIFRSNKDDME